MLSHELNLLKKLLETMDKADDSIKLAQSCMDQDEVQLARYHIEEAEKYYDEADDLAHRLFEQEKFGTRQKHRL